MGSSMIKRSACFMHTSHEASAPGSRIRVAVLPQPQPGELRHVRGVAVAEAGLQGGVEDQPLVPCGRTILS